MILVLNKNTKKFINRGYIVIILGLSSCIMLINNVKNESLNNSLIIGMSLTIILSIISGISLIIKPSVLAGLFSGSFLFILGIYDLLIVDSWTSSFISSLFHFVFGFEIFVYSLIYSDY